MTHTIYENTGSSLLNNDASVVQPPITLKTDQIAAVAAGVAAALGSAPLVTGLDMMWGMWQPPSMPGF